MLHFFRSIRQNLLNENKTVKYLKYAFGEFILVVLGILVALQINNWNEGRKLEQDRRQLIEGLKVDFEENLQRLDQIIPFAESVVQNLTRLLEVAVDNKDHNSATELRPLLHDPSAVVGYNSIMPAYESAKSTGSIALIEEIPLKRLFIEYDLQVSRFQKTADIMRQNTFLGNWWEVRSMVGAEGALFANRFTPEAFKLSDQEFLDFIAQKEVYARIENFKILKEIDLRRMMQLRDYSEQILSALDAL